MKKILLHVLILGSIFLVSLWTISQIMNKGNTDMTTEMGEASFPIVVMQRNDNGELFNPLYGYRQEMDVSTLRGTISPIGTDRNVRFQIYSYGNGIAEAEFELRSGDGKRLIEAGTIVQGIQSETTYAGKIVLKDLIESNQEYSLCFKLYMEDGEPICYYTRLVMSDNWAVDEKIRFVEDFHEKTMNTETLKELSRYLEPNSSGDNSSYAHVNIHSNLKQVGWGNLTVKELDKPLLFVRELASQTMSIVLQYQVKIQETSEAVYNVEEYYRVRYTPERMYLLDFERYTDQILNESSKFFSNNKLVLGIMREENVHMMECDGGHMEAFSAGERLFAYNTADNKLSYLFGFYQEDSRDIRELHREHRIKIMNVEETGNVLFLVYGYMNRGKHEGQVGLQVNYYDGSLNTIEEQAFLSVNYGADILIKEVDKLSFINGTSELFVWLDGGVYRINLETLQKEKIFGRNEDGAVQIASKQNMIVWQNQGSLNSTELTVLDLTNESKRQLKAKSGEYIRPLGFMGKDLIYGMARRKDIVRDMTGLEIFPMYGIRIENENGICQMEYQPENMYVTDCTVEDNQIRLTRVSGSAEIGYIDALDDQIMNTNEGESSINNLETVVTDQFETICQISLKNPVNEKNFMVLTPREVLYEGSRTITIKREEALSPCYFVYAKNALQGMFWNPANAVNLADGLSGVVTDSLGEYVWMKGNIGLRNQIMAIKGTRIEEDGSSLAVCLDTILEYNGLPKNAEYRLQSGLSAADILTENPDASVVLELNGCSLSAMLFYLNRDIPVLVSMDDGECLLLVGYNEQNTVVMNPQSGMVYKMGMKDSTELFEKNGNHFLTYLPKAK